ncbi:MAG: glycosyltransferase [Candidatus Marinimicrobia bacterium]|jgi:glycosyltransferase involved in cell wall biosynthesis|nr:glycosyltransferase [Candidatus Neomarinimicrobiota bacterium]MBT4155830.1 glycosyltransferase [Candidatus Neomarinimicrobiota bacterium]MBT4555781.1 glycosyltransferase [Candidatus Neomarinimicrobiota bacterium]MBT4753203.1 glycosyltransferase [Candidatus Neomarinimicrobiota bacterium]MBT5116219.1 glycosyltransferase [Candidatus Neomarinimicrobiota bacterium]
MPKIDIIIPVYETPIRFVKESLQSILKQSFTDWNAIIIDDASSKDYLLVLQNYIKGLNDSRFQLIVNEINSGAPATRNKGIEKSSADFIAFLDSDDLWKPEKLQIQIAQFSGTDFSLICHNMSTIDEHGNILSKNHQDPSSKYNSLSDEKRLFSLIKRNWVKTSTVMVRKDILIKIGKFDESLQSCQDWDLWIRFALACEPIYCSDVNLTYYRKRDESISSNFDLVLKSRLHVLNKTIPKANHLFKGLISEELEKRLRRNTYLSFSSKYYHSRNFRKAKDLVKKSFQFGIVSRSVSRYLKCILFKPFQSFISKN